MIKSNPVRGHVPLASTTQKLGATLFRRINGREKHQLLKAKNCVLHDEADKGRKICKRDIK
jgi:hypothetical protein